jgi:gp32 DNA binding protein like
MGKITINMDSLKSSRDWVRHKVNDGANIFRILPPFGDPEQHNNYPYRRWSIAWLVDPKSNKRRPFATPLTDGEACPVQEYNDALNTFIEDRKNQLKAEGYSDADVKAELEGLRSVQWNMRLQHVYAYNACDQAGTVGILELKSTAHKAMKKMMNQYIKEHGQDPTSLGCEEDDSGVWFNISKEGKGKDTEYGVSFHQTRQKMNGTLVKIDDRSPLPEHVVANYETLAYDLGSIYVRKNYEDLRSILMFNIALIAQEVPEAAIPGYEVADVEVKTGKTVLSKTTAVDEEVEEAPVAKKTAAAKVTLNLSDDDEDEPAPARKVAAAPAAKAVVSQRPAPVPQPSSGALVKKSAPVQEFDDDELNALTNEILGD